MDLLLTLGHNSSAIGVDGGQVVGYEQERLNRKKSFSGYPIDAISEIAKYIPFGNRPNVFLSHWYDDYSFYSKRPLVGSMERHFNHEAFRLLKPRVVALDEKFTHHDAHAYSAVNFLENSINVADIIDKRFFLFVFDGFGNQQEIGSVYSFYYTNEGKLSMQTVDRYYGYQYSLGLMYQFATAYCGMKENEDEYKFLGYESRIRDVTTDDAIKRLILAANEYANDWVAADKSYKPDVISRFINVDDLTQARAAFYSTFEDVLSLAGMTSDTPSDATRPVIGFFIQNVIEMIYTSMLLTFGVENVVVTGGLHYNVKLNNRILNTIKGLFCVTPLAGDQGAAIGVYRHYYGNTLSMPTLSIGRRNLECIASDLPNVIYVDAPDILSDVIKGELFDNRIVNVVNGPMEFGPRALCNTSTLAWPEVDNVDFINEANGRNTVMPMAPVMNTKGMEYWFDASQYSRVIGSDEHMILTYDYKTDMFRDIEYVRGVAHSYPLSNNFSGRPQVVRNRKTMIKRVLDGTNGVLINTSFNVHGRPIVFSTRDALSDYAFQKEYSCRPEKFSLVILKGDNLDI